MARDPGSAWKPLPEAGPPDGYTKNKFIVHSTGTMASAAANWAYFARAGVAEESTFIVGWGPDDPTLQIMDSTDLADANVSANDEGISVEVVGDGYGPYNDWQISELVRLGLWARREHPLILPQIIPSPAQGSAGFGWHVMFGAPGPWTTVRGKVCPGARRTQQLKDTVFPAIFAGTLMEDDMYGDAQRNEVMTALTEIVGNSRSTNQAVAGLVVRQAALQEQVRQLAEKQGTPIDMAAVEAVVEKGVADAIAGIEATVTVKPSS